MPGSESDLRAIFCEALDRDPSRDRLDYLNQACRGKPDVRARIDALLRAHDETNSFLGEPSPAVGRVRTIDAPAFAERIGSQIGPYKLMEQIGEGGMGLVFVAEQHEPIRRKVALKLIKPGMDTRQVIARFEAERQALALMDHPNIAKIFDGGTTGEPRRVSDRVSPADESRGLTPLGSPPHGAPGRPYFVMELVKGVPITEYCDQNRLTPRARLELFGQVCAAVQHAHQKGIIHRDIKPSNVMVVSHDGVPVVKVIDFGVAKAIGQQLTDKSVYTQFTQFIGTPLYMSPEQAGQSALDIDTRTDIYALGVLLYELLTGTTPFDKERLQEASYDEIRRLIREEEPPKPSTRMSTLAQAGSTVSVQRQTNPQQLCLLLRGELDWIVMKSLEKDRTRRYESASALADDVRRYLKDEPVQACPPSRRYLVGKFLRRHRMGVLTTAALTLAALLFAVGGSWVALDRAKRQTEADLQRIATEQSIEDDLNEADRYLQQENWANVREVLARANGRLTGSGLDTLQAKVEQRRRELDLIALLEVARMKADVVQESFFDQKDKLIESDRAYVAAFAKFDMDVMVLPAEEAVRRIRASTIRSQIVAALDHWAYVRGRLPDANAQPLRTIAQLADDDPWRQRLRDPKVANDRKALERLAEVVESLDQPPASLLILSSLLKAKQSQKAAVTLLRRAQQRYPADFRINFDLGMMLRTENRADRKVGDSQAVRFFQAALALQPRSPHVYIHLADAIGNQGLEHEAEAQAACRKAIELDSKYAEAYFFLSNGLWKQNKLPEAEQMLRKVIELEPTNIRAHDNLVKVLQVQKKISAAEALTMREQSLEIFKDRLGSDHVDTLDSMNELANAYFRAGQLKRATELHEETFKKRKDKLGPNDPDTLMSMFNLAGMYVEAGHLEKGISQIEKVLQKRKDVLEPNHGDTLQSMEVLAYAYEKAGKLDLGESIARESLDIHRSLTEKGSPPSIETAHSLAALGSFLVKRKKYEEAESILQECLEIRAAEMPDAWSRFNAMSMLGGALMGQKKYAKAEPVLLEGYKELKEREVQIPAPFRFRLIEAAERIVGLYEATDMPEKALLWREKLGQKEEPKEKSNP